MAITSDFVYHCPNDLKGALSLLAKEKNALPLAGGTDLICNLKEERAICKNLIDLKNIKGLNSIALAKDKKSIFLGALVTFSDLINSELINKRLPLVMEMSKTVASVAIRNRATLVGNICSAVPSMDSGTILAVYDAKVELRSLKGGSRVVPISKWFVAPKKTALKKGELVLGVTIPLPSNEQAGCYIKLGRYQGEDLAQASISVLALANKQYRIAFGAVAPIPVRAGKIEKLLNGHEINTALLKQAYDLVEQEISPITDIRATAKYRMHMSKVMLGRALIIADERLKGHGPHYGITHL
ncbi:MAG: hypothetical protein A2504_02435 [Bdellovibrionales bacterium RIFOXYD12_FULL_39_22]|nr:MAG: hypothetical protein A2385_12465 [Bdellovibrionales bacterium RIFOXYB1_FULL_39_21]OFZ41162.1 MAG: hypothetical protein A2485_00875 [Bdellovibrionales bacterium RIFOXYC12_FULL_39_17]OFZ44916.1 MAG: hypothetical protein A2404_11620 [Bdellovibrionales bacterium RIFOXYC1_FULL_39_130]OFZ74363.1 MAG: hypothetical protein A2560_11990 [Bdellovibrionales bacterium RIFOXYD1_FULL_39_84]OFZ92365.1 MAG: hypothetical protein A2504_02435 [Bdellovibrionales bacterium RIFOXYD12_FULL_39_22]HLE10692.1 xa